MELVLHAQIVKLLLLTKELVFHRHARLVNIEIHQDAALARHAQHTPDSKLTEYADAIHVQRTNWLRLMVLAVTNVLLAKLPNCLPEDVFKLLLNLNVDNHNATHANKTVTDAWFLNVTHAARTT